MINVLLSGCNGKMGQTLTRLATEFEEMKIAAGYDVNATSDNEYPVFSNLDTCDVKVDVIIDFSHPLVLNNIIEYAKAKKIPTLIATTGLSNEQKKFLEETSKEIPIFFSANMSLGINLLISLVKKATKALHEKFDIEIIEKHHNQKIDAPSGTALALADAINSTLDEKFEYVYDRHSKRKKRTKSEIGMHAVRGGTIVGDHSVIFAGNDEIIELNHIARSKEIFASGALNAAKFLVKQGPGFYNMTHLVE